MLLSVQRQLGGLQRRFERLGRLALIGGALALGLASLVFTLPSSGRSALLWSGLILAYAASQAWLGFRSRRRIKQLRLETQFVRQHLAPTHLRRCLDEAGHIWDRSQILQGLRRALARPLPADTPPNLRLHRTRPHFQRSLAALKPSLLPLSALATLVILGWAWFQTVQSGSLNLIALGLTIAATGLLLSLEIITFSLRRTTRREVAELEKVLSLWTVHGAFEKALQPETYNHNKVYKSRPWFSANAAPSGPALPRWSTLDTIS